MKDQWERIEVGHSLHSLSATEMKTVYRKPLDSPTADGCGEPKLNEDRGIPHAPTLNRSTKVGEPGEQRGELSLDGLKPDQSLRQRLNQHDVRGQQVAHPFRVRIRPELGEPPHEILRLDHARIILTNGRTG